MNELSIFEIKTYCLNKKNISRILRENFFIDENKINFNNIVKKNSNFESKTIDKSNTIGQSNTLGQSNTIGQSNTTKYIKKPTHFIREKDKLFWMLYIFQNSYESYNMLGKNTYSFEMKEKTKYVKQIKKDKKDLKQYKIKISELEADLLYSKAININTFFILLILNKINFIYYTENLVFQWKRPNNETTFILNHDKKNNIYYDEDKALVDEYFNDLKKTRLVIDNLNKPIKGVSTYKVNEIKEICSKLQINIMKNAKKTFSKKELYEKIVQKIS